MKDQFFWRQTYDYVGTKTFSDLRKICIDDAPVNPDEMILQCPSKECRKWQHIRCMATEAAQQAGPHSLVPIQHPSTRSHPADSDADTSSSSKKPTKKKAKPNDSVTIRSNSLAQAKAETGTASAEVMIAGLPDGEGLTPAKYSHIEITDAEGAKSIKEVLCLFCGAKID